VSGKPGGRILFGSARIAQAGSVYAVPTSVTWHKFIPPCVMCPRKFNALFVFVILSASLQAQIGGDHDLIDRFGSPVVVPLKVQSESPYGNHTRYHIPGTMRHADRNVMGERVAEEEGFIYSTPNPFSDTTQVFVIDSNGQPIRKVQPFEPEPEPVPDEEIQVFSAGNEETNEE
jgi:hypothetical protein